jgi:uncharacterized phage protein (TIGR02220 family)
MEVAMAKDAYYFSHDSNAKDDPKCVMLIEQLGLEGYGIYWVLIEMLRDQPEYKYPLSLIPAISRRYNTTSEKMKTVIGNYGLFTVDDNDFFSLALMKRMEFYEYKREIARAAGKKSAEKRLLNSGSTDVQPTFNGGSTSKVDVSTVEESTEEHIPYSEIINYLNMKTGKNFSTKTDATVKFINGRWSDGKTLDDFKKVIDVKCKEWLGKKDREGKPLANFLRPSTLFSPANFENYLNQETVKAEPSKIPFKIVVEDRD